MLQPNETHKLNEKGQCPHCLRKPLPYPGQKMYACLRCGRYYDFTTCEQIPSDQWHRVDGQWVDEYPKSTVENDAKLAKNFRRRGIAVD